MSHRSRWFADFPALTPPLNTLRLKALFPSFHCSRSSGRPVWRGELQPQESSPVYRVRIEWRGTRSPCVVVESPRLQCRAPHRYSNGSLCLFDPKDRSWHPHLYIAETIVPWTAEWLFFYEIWMLTGSWYGPEAPHPVSRRKRSK
jgi:hypothetical protein